MINISEQYSSLEGYGIFCGKKCVAKKKAQGLPPKRGKKNIAEWEAQQVRDAQMYAESEEGGSSKTPLIIGGIVLLGVIGAIIYIVKKKSA
tara:strand:- start:12319 stop:12591 length:273 start_codon:yes stop_codon:yes gene_type:complete